MAPTEVRVARPERRWGCRRGTQRQHKTRVSRSHFSHVHRQNSLQCVL